MSKCGFHKYVVVKSEINKDCPCLNCVAKPHQCEQCTTGYLNWKAKNFDLQMQKCIKCHKCR